MEIERLHAALIKPSNIIAADGPPQLVELSEADVALSPMYVPILYAFAAPAVPTSALEAGLSKVLCVYREFAGRLTDGSSRSAGHPSLLLTDDGALFIHAQAHGACLEDLWPFHPSHPVLPLLSPLTEQGPELLRIQVTRFACGGLTLGISWNHQVTDGEGACEFFEAWASVVRGVPIACPPYHDRTALIEKSPYIELEGSSPKPMYEDNESEDLSLKRENCELVRQRLHFTPNLLKSINMKACEGAAEGIRYSNFVSLLAHMWKCIMRAQGLEREEGETRCTLSVSLRNRLKPPLPRGFFGNAICQIYPQVKTSDLVSKPLSFAASHVHAALQKINNNPYPDLNFIKPISKQGLPKQDARASKVCTQILYCSSWIRLPLYTLDFGSGPAIYAGFGFIPFDGFALFAPSHKKDGSINVELALLPAHMEKLESICFDLDA